MRGLPYAARDRPLPGYQIRDTLIGPVTRKPPISSYQRSDSTIEMSMITLSQVDSRALGVRLAERLHEKGWSYKEFQRRVQSAAGGARGTSYGTVWSYVNGEVSEPRAKVVQAMADVLGLSTDWLLSGEGPRTHGEVARRSVRGETPEAKDDRTDRLGVLYRAMEAARARLPQLESDLLTRRDHVIENLVVDLLESGGRGLETYGEGEVAEAMVLVSWLISLPLRILGPDELRRRRRGAEEYVLAMGAALRIAMAEPPGGQPFNSLSRLRRLRAALMGVTEAPGSSSGGEPERAAH